MSKYNPHIHHRRSIRLKGYDYSQAGLYFVTICVRNRLFLFGNVVNGEMILNDAGKMIEKWYFELENKYPDIRCHEMVVMPNHFHCIIENVAPVAPVAPVGADLCVCPNRAMQPLEDEQTGGESPVMGESPILGEHVGSPLHGVVGWFKTMTTNEYIRGVKNLGWERFDGKLWQRNYWEHIIRDEQARQNIARYIVNNPLNWGKDKLR